MKKNLLKRLLTLCLAAVVCFGCGVSVGAQEIRTAVIFSVSGDVQVKRGGDRLLPAFEGMRLNEGDIIITGNDASAVIEIDSDKTLDIAANSELALNEISGNATNGHTTASLFFGEIVNSIVHKLSKDSTFTTLTPNASMSVRGTVYYVGMQDEGSNLVVSKGKVQVASAGEQGITPRQEDPIVEKGKMRRSADEEIRTVDLDTLLTLSPSSIDALVDDDLLKSAAGKESSLQSVSDLADAARQTQEKQKQENAQNAPAQESQTFQKSAPVYFSDIAADTPLTGQVDAHVGTVPAVPEESATVETPESPQVQDVMPEGPIAASQIPAPVKAADVPSSAPSAAQPTAVAPAQPVTVAPAQPETPQSNSTVQAPREKKKLKVSGGSSGGGSSSGKKNESGGSSSKPKPTPKPSPTPTPTPTATPVPTPTPTPTPDPTPVPTPTPIPTPTPSDGGNHTPGHNLEIEGLKRYKTSTDKHGRAYTMLIWDDNEAVDKYIVTDDNGADLGKPTRKQGQVKLLLEVVELDLVVTITPVPKNDMDTGEPFEAFITKGNCEQETYPIPLLPQPIMKESECKLTDDTLEVHWEPVDGAIGYKLMFDKKEPVTLDADVTSYTLSLEQPCESLKFYICAVGDHVSNFDSRDLTYKIVAQGTTSDSTTDDPPVDGSVPPDGQDDDPSVSESDDPDLDASETDTSKSETSGTDITESDTSESDALESETSGTDITDPDTSESDALELETSGTDITEPETLESDTLELETPGTDTSKPDTSEMDASETDSPIANDSDLKDDS